MHWFIAANDPVTYEGEQLERDLKYLPFRYKYLIFNYVVIVCD